MKIAAIDTILLTVPYRTSGQLHFIAGRPAAGLNMLLVRVVTDDGVEGWGEAFGHAVAPGTKAVIDTMIAPLLIGRDPSDIATLMLDVQRKLHIFGRNGPVTYGISGIDIALWDIAGKVAGVPLYRLLGGSERQDVAAYSSLLRCASPDAVAESCRVALAQGFVHIKLHEITAPAIRAAREAIGPTIALMVDTNCPWSLAEALEMVECLKPLDLYWLEEPIWPPEDYASLARVRASGAIVAAGENVVGTAAFEQLLRAGAVDVLQPSVSKAGGITELRSVTALASSLSVRTVPHCGYLGPGFFATLHLVASMRDEAVLLERLNVEVEESPFGDATEVRQGRVPVPQAPGLGRDPDMAVVERYRVA